MEERKQIERRRYDDAAAQLLDREGFAEHGAAGIPPEFRHPYVEFERHIVAIAKPGAVVMDIGAGTGAFSLVAHGKNRLLIATDISPIALLVAGKRARAAGSNLCLVCADAEHLPFRDLSIDMITSAGALYCFSLPTVTDQVRRVLRRPGTWVIVDSLNESPIYRFNRWLGFLRRRRTALAVTNVPTTASIRELRQTFETVRVSYHGVLTFLLPILKPLLGAVRAGSVVSGADSWLRWFRRWAFKVVIVAEELRRA